MAQEHTPDWADYDAGLLNDFGGGDVEWWQDYMRAEIERANGNWRSQSEAFEASSQAEIARLRAALEPFARATDVINISYRVSEAHLAAAKAALSEGK